MRRRHKVLFSLLVLPVATFLLLATIFNEAFLIQRAWPKAQVTTSHRFTQVLSPWDWFGFLVPGDYVSPIDHAEVAISGSKTPVDMRKLLSFRVTHVQIVDSEIVNFDGLLTGHEPNVPITLVNPTFLGASPEALKLLDKHKVPDPDSGKDVYQFGSV